MEAPRYFLRTSFWNFINIADVLKFFEIVKPAKLVVLLG